jgi:hypothetical protein
MKHLKMLGLAALAVMGLMAFLGAGTASAARLEINTTPTANDSVPLRTRVTATLEPGTTATLSDEFGFEHDTCTSSTVEGEIERDTTSPTPVNPQGAVRTLTFGGCSETTTVLARGELILEHITGTTNGTVVSRGARVSLFSTILNETCTADTTAGTPIGTLTGAGHGLSNATIDVSARLTLTGCGISRGRWVGRYEVTSPARLTVE